MNNTDFIGFPKMARLSREIIITEKLDGTNAQIYITDDGQFFTGSRTRWITPEDDNHGFSRWAHENKNELLKLGPGRHFGEWWGKGIQRGYGINEKRFSLFNVKRWYENLELPKCCRIVPILAAINFDNMIEYPDDFGINAIMGMLKRDGSFAAPGYMNPEGIVIFHTAANICFKKTFVGDEGGKNAV